MKLSIKDFFSKCDEICRKLQIWSHLLKKSLMKYFTFFRVRSKYVCKHVSKYVFTVLHCLFYHFKVDLKFGQILNIWEGSE